MSTVSGSEVVLVAASLVGLVGDALYTLPHARRDLDGAMFLPPRSDQGAALAALGWTVAALAAILLCAMAVLSWRDRMALLETLRSEKGSQEPLDSTSTSGGRT